MGVWTTAWQWLGLVVSYLWTLFLAWISILTAPFRNFEILWIIIPIWLSWFFAEWFQEKEGTSYGNAISNGIVVVWVGVDWLRYLTTLHQRGLAQQTLHFWPKISIAVLVLCYGLAVVVYGIKRRKFVHMIGRIREVTYLLLMFTPIVYGAIDISLQNIFAILLFFPLFYGIIEFIDYHLPSPETYKEDRRG